MIVRWTEAGNLHVDESEREHKVTVVFHGMGKLLPAEKLAVLQEVVEQAGRIPERTGPRILQ